jgi:hypothetical protein
VAESRSTSPARENEPPHETLVESRRRTPVKPPSSARVAGEWYKFAFGLCVRDALWARHRPHAPSAYSLR